MIFSPQSRVLLAPTVYEQLRLAIITCQLPPQARLKDKEIAEEVGTSRTPVRESFKRLEAERLVYALPNKGTYVSEIPDRHYTAELWSALLDVGNPLFASAVLSCAGSIPPHVQELAIAADSSNAGQHGSPARARLLFFSALASLSGNRPLADASHGMRAQFTRLEVYASLQGEVFAPVPCDRYLKALLGEGEYRERSPEKNFEALTQESYTIIKRVLFESSGTPEG